MPSFRVTALLAAYNEEDVIRQVIGDLIAQGVDVYLIDHASTDATVKEASVHLGKGLLHIEHYPEESGFPADEVGRFAWKNLLRRKEQLATSLDATWFLHQDADELRESPWDGVGLREAVQRVDGLGYNAIAFKAINFVPTDEAFERSRDLRTAFRYYRPAAHYDALRINAWKKREPAVDLASTGGHEARFEGRSVCPLRFLLRHYPIRGQLHGERKVLRERLPRYDTEEKAGGWHRQYNAVDAQTSFVAKPEWLLEFDPAAMRAELQEENREFQLTQTRLEDSQRQVEVLSKDLEWYRLEWPRRERELMDAVAQLEEAHLKIAELERALVGSVAQLEEARSGIAELERALMGSGAQLEEARSRIAALERSDEEFREENRRQGAYVGELRLEIGALQARIDSLLRSLSWRATGPLRSTLRRLRGY
jgi:hypothetical protein